MESKYLGFLSSIILFIILNPFLVFTNVESRPPHQPSNKNPPALDYLKGLVGTRKGNLTKGISQLKKYLSNLGYMKTNNNGNQNDDLFDEDLELAIKAYQTYFKLTVNGILDANTVAKLSQPRCGVPDHFAKKTQIKIPVTASHYTFFDGKPTWPPTKRLLTYSFPPDIRPDVNESILDASNMWANVSPFKFSFIPDYDKADVKISFQYLDHGDGYPFDGEGGIVAHAFSPPDGRLHFDEDDRWFDGVTPGAFDLQTVGLHELGHILGLGHSTDHGAIMYPLIDIGSRRGLGKDDINGIRALYPS